MASAAQPPALALYLTLIAVAVPSLFYQNSGWIQFGQRFSNDYSPWLFALLAVGIERVGRLFHAAASWSLVVNLFGALTFRGKTLVITITSKQPNE